MFFTALVLCILIEPKKAKQYTENLIAKFQNLNQNFHLFWVSLVLFHLCVKKMAYNSYCLHSRIIAWPAQSLM